MEIETRFEVRRRTQSGITGGGGGDDYDAPACARCAIGAGR